MLSPYARCDGYRSYGYGLMVSPAFPDGQLIEHGGSLKGISSHIFAIPATGLTGVILINLDGVAVRELVAALLNTMASRPAAVPAYPVPHYEVADEQLSEYEGRYESQEWTKVLIEKREGELYLEVDGLSYPLIPVDKDSFLFKRRNSHVWIDFFRSAKGQIERMSYSLRQLSKVDAS